MFSYLAFVLALVLAERALKGSNRALVALAALIVVWANLHLSFSLGVGVIGLVACARAWRTRAFRRPVLVAATALGAGAVNPYGVTAYTIGLQVRGVSRFVQEWRPFDVTKPIDVLVVLFAVAALAVMWRAKRLRNLEVSAPVVVLLALTIDSTRMAPFLLLAAAPELALGLSWARWPDGLATPSRRRALVHGAVAGIAIVAVVAAMRMQLPRPVPDTTFPVRTAAAIPAGCRLLNEYDQGGYLIDHRWPDVLVSEDGRNDLYGEAALVAQYDVLNAQPGWQQWLDTNHVDCVLAYPYRPLVARLRALGWREPADDPSAVLLLRPGI